MKSEIFLISQPHGQADFERFTSKPDVVINQVNTTAHGPEVKATVYYETLEGLSDAERVRLTAHAAIANECSANHEYNQLSTMRARELWLLAEWGVCCSAARDIIELTDNTMITVRSVMGVVE